MVFYWGKMMINHRILWGILYTNPHGYVVKTFQVDWVPDNQHEANAKSGDEGGASPYLAQIE